MVSLQRPELHPFQRASRLVLLFWLSLSWLLSAAPAAAQEPEPSLLLLGSTHPVVFPGFVEAAIQRSRQDLVDILLLPSGLASDPLFISPDERQELLLQVESQARQMAAICSQKITADMRCRVSFAPALVRSDAQTIAWQDYFNDSLSAVLILEEQPHSAAAVINGTALERQLSNAYYAGILVAGGNYLSRAHITGYTPGSSIENVLEYGAVAAEIPPGIPANPYQLRHAFLSTSFYQADSIGQLVNALTLPAFPDVAVGVEEFGGIQLLSNRKLQDPLGDSLVPVFDGATYHASAGAVTTGPRNSLSLRNLLLHTLAAGDFSYDLILRQHSMNPPPARLQREFSGMQIPSRAGILVLSGRLETAMPDSPVLAYFLNQAGGQNAVLYLIVSGYPTSASAMLEAAAYSNLLPVSLQVQYVTETDESEITIPTETTGLVLLARYPSLLDGLQLDSLEQAWRRGLPLLAIDAGASLAGSYFVTQELPGAANSASPNRPPNFGQLRLEPGLGLAGLNIEPQVNEENRWGRLLHLAYNHPGQPAIGLSAGSAVVVTQNGAFTIGERPAAVLDLSHATLGLGNSAQLVVANGFLDIFAPGEILAPQAADMNAAPLPSSALPGSPPATPTPTHSPTATTTPTAAVTPTPMEAEFIIPIEDLPIQPAVLFRPPPGQILTFLLIALPVFTFLVILVGLWINRKALR